MKSIEVVVAAALTALGPAMAFAQQEGGGKPEAAATPAAAQPSDQGKADQGDKGAAAPAQTAAVAPAAGGGAPPYTVVDGDKVDANTMNGWRTWRAMACERCHGPNQEGLVGPSLVNSLKVLTKDQFKTTLMNGRPDKGMPNFGGVKTVVDNLDNLYAYLKGRSDGAIKPGHLHQIEK